MMLFNWSGNRFGVFNKVQRRFKSKGGLQNKVGCKRAGGETPVDYGAKLEQFMQLHKDKFDDYERYMSEQTTSEVIERVGAMETSSKKHILEEIFQICDDLTGDELRELVKKRRMQLFTDKNDGSYVIVYDEIWVADDIMWNGMAEIFNAWSVGEKIRTQCLELQDDIVLVIDLEIPQSFFN